jgi:phosphatidylglycerol---prolipoprotein diacylglyceryl transferase
MNPIAIRIGPIAVHWYGILIVAGALAGAYVASREAKRRGWDPDHIWNSLFLTLVLGIVGARLYHVLTPSPSSGLTLSYFIQHPEYIIATWQGGLGIYGGIAGGILGFYLYMRWNRLDFLKWADLAIMGLPLGQAIGRWGNFVNQELYGRPTTLPWGIYIDPAHRYPGYESYNYFHPVFLYESIWNVGVCVVLVYVAHRWGERLLKGEILTVYLILYPLGRILMEFVRLDSTTVGSVPVAQIVSVVCIVIAAAVLVYRRKVVGEQPSGWASERKPVVAEPSPAGPEASSDDGAPKSE